MLRLTIYTNPSHFPAPSTAPRPEHYYQYVVFSPKTIISTGDSLVGESRVLNWLVMCKSVQRILSWWRDTTVNWKLDGGRPKQTTQVVVLVLCSLAFDIYTQRVDMMEMHVSRLKPTSTIV